MFVWLKTKNSILITPDSIDSDFYSIRSLILHSINEILYLYLMLINCILQNNNEAIMMIIDIYR
ncbi:hypothetical protein DERF_014194 [Dermatophagoides farinae]|uniref:Uncharacterized protein n=1 Tax=Dermatophagoides farinae TaxID=6954 RepID=A0A922KWE6_DERFA|nr:hypothetical protein DERF_014194 [Dermatophagoides farinae]